MQDFWNQKESELIKLRRYLHRNPELSGREQSTAALMRDKLEKTNPDKVLTDLGGSGVMAVYDSGHEGPTVLLRAELDALPIEDSREMDIEHRSNRKGVGHKCGHDGHMAILIGVADYIGTYGLKKGRLLLLFQPAEETGEGADWVLNDKQFQKYEPDAVYALHNLPGYEKGQIVVRDGPFAAASTGVEITLRGETAHAAHPEDGRSPALAVAALINFISSLPQGHISRQAASKATVIHTKIGERAFGTTPGYAKVMATLRAYQNETLDKLTGALEGYVRQLGEAHSLEVELGYEEPFKATVNESSANERIRHAAGELSLPVTEPGHAFAWSEDFGRFTDRFSGALFGIGSGVEQPQLHSGMFDFPDEILNTGSRMFMGILKDYGLVE